MNPALSYPITLAGAQCTMENLYNCSYQQYGGTTCCTELRNIESKGPEQVRTRSWIESSIV